MVNYELIIFIVLLLIGIFVTAIVLIGIFACSIYLFRKSKGKSGEKWKQTADKLGLNFTPPPNRPLDFKDRKKTFERHGRSVEERILEGQTMYGNFQGRRVEIAVETNRNSVTSVRGSFAVRDYTTYCEAFFENKTGFDFQILGKNQTEPELKIYGDRGEQFGIKHSHPEFDAKFFAGAQNLRKLEEILVKKANDNRSLAERLTAHFNDDSVIEAVENKVAVKFPYLVSDAEKLSNALKIAVELALRFEMALAN